jgi:hypothetical protein
VKSRRSAQHVDMFGEDRNVWINNEEFELYIYIDIYRYIYIYIYYIYVFFYIYIYLYIYKELRCVMSSTVYILIVIQYK